MWWLLLSSVVVDVVVAVAVMAVVVDCARLFCKSLMCVGVQFLRLVHLFLVCVGFDVFAKRADLLKFVVLVPLLLLVQEFTGFEIFAILGFSLLRVCGVPPDLRCR